MWLITNDWCGMFCAFFTYVVVVTVYLGFIRIGIWDQLLNGDIKAYAHLAVFQTCCFLIFWTHFKCMTTQPGVLPCKQSLKFDILPKEI